MAKRSSVEVPVKEVKQIDKWIYKIGERKTDTAKSVVKILQRKRATLEDIFETGAPKDLHSIAEILLHSEAYHLPEPHEIDFAINVIRHKYPALSNRLNSAYSELNSWKASAHRTDLTDDESLECLANFDASYNIVLKLYSEVSLKVSREPAAGAWDFAYS